MPAPQWIGGLPYQMGLRLPDETATPDPTELDIKNYYDRVREEREQYRKTNPTRAKLGDVFGGFTGLSETALDDPNASKWDKIPGAIGELMGAGGPIAAAKGLGTALGLGKAAATAKGVALAGMPFSWYVKNNKLPHNAITHGTMGRWGRFKQLFNDEADILGWLFHGAEEGPYSGQYALGWKKGKADHRHARTMPLHLESENVLDLIDPNMDDMAQAIASVSPEQRKKLIAQFRRTRSSLRNEPSDVTPIELRDRYGLDDRHFPQGVPREDIPLRTLSENIRLGPQSFPNTPFDSIRYNDITHQSWAWPGTTRVRSAISPMVDFTEAEHALDTPLEVINTTRLGHQGGNLSKVEAPVNPQDALHKSLLDAATQEGMVVTDATTGKQMKPLTSMGGSPKTGALTNALLDATANMTHEEKFGFINKFINDNPGLNVYAKNILYNFQDMDFPIHDQQGLKEAASKYFADGGYDPLVDQSSDSQKWMQAYEADKAKVDAMTDEQAALINKYYAPASSGGFHLKTKDYKTTHAAALAEHAKLMEQYKKNYYINSTEKLIQDRTPDIDSKYTHNREGTPKATISDHYKAKLAELEAADEAAMGMKLETPLRPSDRSGTLYDAITPGYETPTKVPGESPSVFDYKIVNSNSKLDAYGPEELAEEIQDLVDTHGLLATIKNYKDYGGNKAMHDYLAGLMDMEYGTSISDPNLGEQLMGLDLTKYGPDTPAKYGTAANFKTSDSGLTMSSTDYADQMSGKKPLSPELEADGAMWAPTTSADFALQDVNDAYTSGAIHEGPAINELNTAIEKHGLKTIIASYKKMGGANLFKTALIDKIKDATGLKLDYNGNDLFDFDLSNLDSQWIPDDPKKLNKHFFDDNFDPAAVDVGDELFSDEALGVGGLPVNPKHPKEMGLENGEAVTYPDDYGEGLPSLKVEEDLGLKDYHAGLASDPWGGPGLTETITEKELAAKIAKNAPKTFGGKKAEQFYSEVGNFFAGDKIKLTPPNGDPAFSITLKENNATDLNELKYSIEKGYKIEKMEK